MKMLLALVVTLLLAGCVYSPKKSTYYDQGCKANLNKMTLESKELKMGSMKECSDEACYLNLLIPGIVTAGSIIVSGSIVVTANTIYWLEKSIKCP